jgi:hypothetical protein
MTERTEILAKIAVGDLFHATSPNGASLICLALDVTNTVIFCETVTSVYALEFDRTTGLAERDFHGESVVCTIDSVARLPKDIEEVLVRLHRVYSRKDEDDNPKLKDLEHRALVFAAQYFPAHPIAPPDQTWEMMSVGKSVGKPTEPREYESLTREEKIELILINFLIPRNRAQEA